MSFGSDCSLAQCSICPACVCAGVRSPGTHGPGAAGLGKKAWSSEDYSQVSNGAGPACWARVINRNFVTGNLTATIAWNLVDSYYDGLPFGRKGLMTAFNPWSGHYDVDDPIWSTAHTTQFTKAGWLYSPVGAGSGWLPQGGSYVTLVPGTAARSSHGMPVAPTMTMVIEKMDPAKSKCEWEGVGNSTTPQNETVTFALYGDLAAITSLHVWRSNLGGGGGDSNSGSGRPGVFETLDPVAVAGGRFSIELCAECVFTVTTLSTGQKGSFGKLANVTGWSAATSTAGFSDDFESYNISSEAAYWSDMAGSWEIVDATAFFTAQVAAADDTVDSGRGGHSGRTTFGSKGKVMRQMVPSPPIFGIRTEVRPLSMIGEKNWRDTNMTIDAMVEETGNGVYIGVNYLGLTSGPGYFLAVQGSRWSTALNVATIGNGSNTQSGVLPAALALLPGSWRRLSLSVNSGKAAASIDGHTLFADVPVKSTQTGFGVMGTVDYTVAQFDNFFVQAAYRGPSPAPAPGPGPAPAPGPSPGPSPPNPSAPVKCKAPAAGQSVRLWTCDPSRDEWQGWNVTSGQPISMLHASNLCLGIGPDKLVQLMPCASAPSFIVASASSMATANSVHLQTQKGNECMDVAPHPDPHFGGSCPVDIWGCNNRFDGGANQLFELAGAHTSNPIGAIVSALWGKDLCVSVCA